MKLEQVNSKAVESQTTDAAATIAQNAWEKPNKAAGIVTDVKPNRSNGETAEIGESGPGTSDSGVINMSPSVNGDMAGSKNDSDTDLGKPNGSGGGQRATEKENKDLKDTKNDATGSDARGEKAGTVDPKGLKQDGAGSFAKPIKTDRKPEETIKHLPDLQLI